MRRCFWEEIDALRGRWDVLEHPFCRRWSAGDLGCQELKAYASEYEHAVVAIATAARRAADLGGGPLLARAAEEEEHVRIWRKFARASGWGGSGCWGYAEEPLPETETCARVWAGDEERGLAQHLISLYAIESAQAAVSKLKLQGLREHYGYAEGPETEYFALHARADAGHADLIRGALDAAPQLADEELLLGQVEAVGRAHWNLLDGVSELAWV